MTKFSNVGLLAVSLLLSSRAEAVLLGPPVIAGNFATDGGIFQAAPQYAFPVPSNGQITGFAYYKQEAQASGSGVDKLAFFILRPTATTGAGVGTAAGDSTTYSVLYVSPHIDTTGLPVGVNTYTLGSPVAVQAGDVFGHVGKGIAFTTSSDKYFLTAVGGANIPPYQSLADGNISSFTASGTTQPFQWAGLRTYSLAADFSAAQTPEPASLMSFVVGAAGSVFIWNRRRRKMAQLQAADKVM